MVLINVTVTDRDGRPVEGLTKDDFTVLDDNAPQVIDLFDRRDNPASIGIVFDASASMRAKRSVLWDAARQEAGRLVRESNPANEYFLLAITSKLLLLKDWSSDPQAINVALNRLPSVPPGYSLLYDACYESVGMLQKRENARRAILLVTGGRDDHSQHSVKDLLTLTKWSDVQVYPITIMDPLKEALTLGPEDLRKLAAATGGASFPVINTDYVRRAFGDIAAQLRHQYLIGYFLPSRDDKWHTVKVKVRPHEIKDPDHPNKSVQMHVNVRTREGYYAVKRGEK